MLGVPVDKPELGVGLVGVEVGDVVGKQGFAQEHGGDDVHMADVGGGVFGGLATRKRTALVFRLPLGVACADIQQGGGE